MRQIALVWSGLVAGLGIAVLGSAEAQARYAPLQTTWHGAVDRVAEVVERAQTLGPTLGIPSETLTELSTCEALDGGRAVSSLSQSALSDCIDALAHEYDLARARSAIDDGIVRGMRAYLARGLADAAFRLRALSSPVRPGALPAQILVAEDGRTLRLRPLRALRPGRRWTLVVEGLTTDELEHVRATAVPRSAGTRPAVLPGAFVEPIAEGLRTDPVPMNRDEALAIARRLEADAGSRAGASPTAGVQVRLPTPLRGADLRRLSAAFVPPRIAPSDVSVVEIFVADGRASLLDLSRRLDALECPGTVARELPSAAPPRTLHGIYPSLAIVGTAGGHPSERPADAAPATHLPFRMALPGAIDDSTPLVIGVHGHHGAADRFLRAHAGGLTERGAALLTVELPHHGLRGAHATRFLGAEDPITLRANFRQAVVDVLAALAYVRHCGIRLPDGATYRPTDVRYLGFSLGSLLGVTVRSLAADLGPAALVAPAGDLAAWLLFRVPARLDAMILVCVGGPDHGASCIDDRACTPPGACRIDPDYARILFLLDLPYGLALADAEPLGPARVRTGAASHAPALLVTGGQDGVLHSLLQARLADAYDMHGEPPDPVRGPRSERIHFPELGHDLLSDARVRERVYDFLTAPRRGTGAQRDESR